MGLVGAIHITAALPTYLSVSNTPRGVFNTAMGVSNTSPGVSNTSLDFPNTSLGVSNTQVASSTGVSHPPRGQSETQDLGGVDEGFIGASPQSSGRHGTTKPTFHWIHNN